jgi:hypothetical protein
LQELLRTDDIVQIARLTALLEEQGIETYVFDSHLSAAFAGAIDLLSQRLMVSDDDYPRARRILQELGEPLPDD